MNKLLKGFTMVELLIALTILVSVLVIISGTFIQVHKSIFEAHKTTQIFNDFNDFFLEQNIMNESKNYNYFDSGYDFLLLEKNSVNYLYGVFRNDGEYFTAVDDRTNYNEQKFGYMIISDNYKSEIISNGISSIITLKYYNGKVFNALDVDGLDITLSSYNSKQIAFLRLKSIKKIPELKDKKRLELPLERFIFLNIAL